MSTDVTKGKSDSNNITERWRLVTGCADGQVRVFAIKRSSHFILACMNGINIIPSSFDVNKEKELSIESLRRNSEDICHYMGMFTPPANVSTSNEKVVSVQFHPNGKYFGFTRFTSKNVDIYAVRSELESSRKKVRRLKRKKS